MRKKKESSISVPVTLQKGKRYFTDETQKYVVKYNNSTDPEERSRIFKNYLYYPFYKLAENIIHTYKFYQTDGEAIEDLKLDLVRAIFEEKIDKYDPSKNAAAFSYFGTVMRHLLIGFCNNNYKKLKKQISLTPLEEYYQENLNEESKEVETAPTLSLSSFIDNWVGEMYENLDSMFPRESDRQIADAILTLFRTRQDIQIFKKKALYIYIREITNCETVYLTKVVLKLKEDFYSKYTAYAKQDLISYESVK